MNGSPIISYDVDVEQSFAGRLENCLPPNINTIVTSFDKVDTSDNGDKFSAILRLSIFNKEEALKWLEDFKNKTMTHYNIDASFKENSLKTVFKRVYHCNHNTRPRPTVTTPSKKHTNCPAKITINVKNARMQRSKDKLLKSHPCQVFMRWNHNHVINCANALRFRKPTKALEEAFRVLFSHGHSPSSALEMFKADLRKEHPGDYLNVVADGSRCPTRKWCYDLYYAFLKKEYREPAGPETVSAIKEYMCKYNEECRETCVAMDHEENDSIVIALCSPLMKRVHRFIPSSADVMFVDSSGNLDRQNNRILLFLCPTLIGALPLGLIITFKDSSSSIYRGLLLLLKLLKNSGFYGAQEPSTIISDTDCEAQVNALKKAFERSNVLVSKFRIAQGFMKCLWTGGQVENTDRAVIFREFLALLHTNHQSQFDLQFARLLESDVVSKSPRLMKYLEKCKAGSQVWALRFRATFKTNETDTNQFSEAGFRVMKEKVFKRTKPFTIVQLVDFLIRNLQNFYEKKISTAANDKAVETSKLKYVTHKSHVENYRYQQLSENLYCVVSGNKDYFVNPELELCSCSTGIQGIPCKHQIGVISHFNLAIGKCTVMNNGSFRDVLRKLIGHHEGLVPEQLFGSFNELPGGEDNYYNTLITPQNEPTSKSQHKFNDTTSFSAEDIAREENKLIQFCLRLKNNLNQRPHTYFQAVRKFNLLCGLMRTDSDLVSALGTFGECNQVRKERKVSTHVSQRMAHEKRKATAVDGGRESPDLDGTLKRCRSEEGNVVVHFI